MLWVNCSSGPASRETVSSAVNPDRAKSESAKVLNHFSTSSLDLFVKRRPTLPRRCCGKGVCVYVCVCVCTCDTKYMYMHVYITCSTLHTCHNQNGLVQCSPHRKDIHVICVYSIIIHAYASTVEYHKYTLSMLTSGKIGNCLWDLCLMTNEYYVGIILYTISVLSLAE